jgi:hypothetical protein
MQLFDGARRRCRGGHGAELEGIENHWTEAMQHRPCPCGQRSEVHLVGADQAYGFGDACRKLLPADGGHDAAIESAPATILIVALQTDDHRHHDRWADRRKPHFWFAASRVVSSDCHSMTSSQPPPST